MTNKTKLQTYTPGPWKVQMRRGALGTRGHVAVLGPDFGSGHADIVRTMGTSDRDEANARLIAAAPDLLAALKSAIEYAKAGDADRVVFVARAAIAKAEGKEGR